jgi:hypothetical protein
VHVRLDYNEDPTFSLAIKHYWKIFHSHVAEPLSCAKKHGTWQRHPLPCTLKLMAKISDTTKYKETHGKEADTTKS